MYIDSRVMPRSRTKASFVLLAGGREGRGEGGGRGPRSVPRPKNRSVSAPRQPERDNHRLLSSSSRAFLAPTHPFYTHPVFSSSPRKSPVPPLPPPPVGVPIFAICALSSSSSSSSSFIASSPSQTTRMSYLCSGKKFSKFRERFFPVSFIQRRIRWSSKANYFIERI